MYPVITYLLVKRSTDTLNLRLEYKQIIQPKCTKITLKPSS